MFHFSQNIKYLFYLGNSHVCREVSQLCDKETSEYFIMSVLLQAEDFLKQNAFEYSLLTS